ncbi:MAG: pentapeptide repeat-containing protein [Acidobacteria bacterium]|nr:pentapeptide repeat-containing protein [Acidobacteriota bacterium]MYH50773.1 pentapeptide repeat-containing protein [Gammaproteobacteria bacterium]MYK80339.1 pentapeptide repeat-containing protein [Acidobacteriota bacterium]
MKRLALFPLEKPHEVWWRRVGTFLWSGLTSICRFLVSGRVLVVILSAGILAIGVSVSIWHWDALNSNGESLSATIRNVAVVLGGVIALVLSIWRSSIADRQADTGRRQVSIAQRGLWNERYQKGAEMLGSDVLSVRLGGVYALDRLAREHPTEYHVPIIQLFCAFVRNPAGKQTEKELRRQRKKPTAPTLRVDIQEVVTAIGRRSEDGIKAEKASEGFALDLTGADLRNVSLEDGNFRGVDLSGAYLMHSFLANVDFRGARCRHAHLFMAQFLFCDLTDVDLSLADLSGANLFTSVLRNAELTSTEIDTGWELHATDPPSYLPCFAQLTQAQLDMAKADGDSPPVIAAGTKDSETGAPLVWRHQSSGKHD